MTLEYRAGADNNWQGWQLEVTARRTPREFALSGLKSLPARTQITRHDCVEGWSAIAKWKGVPLAEIVAGAGLWRQPVTLFFIAWIATAAATPTTKASISSTPNIRKRFWRRMNDRALSIEHGAPLRLRVENQLGYKHAKYIGPASPLPASTNWRKAKAVTGRTKATNGTPGFDRRQLPPFSHPAFFSLTHGFESNTNSLQKQALGPRPAGGFHQGLSKVCATFKGTATKKILLIAHMHTVYPRGMLEYALIESIEPRLYLLARMIMDLFQGKDR